jgi:hypothetical protein
LNEKVTLVPLTPEQCFLRWEWLRAGLLVCINKTKARHLPEDVYARIRANTAWAYVINVDGVDRGFYVLTQEPDPDGLVLFVWALWAESGSMKDIHPAAMLELVELAKKAKAIRIRMQSPRGAWERDPYFTPVAVVYEYEVSR